MEKREININSIGRLSSSVTFNNQTLFQIQDTRPLIDEIINLNLKLVEVKNDMNCLITQKYHFNHI